MPATSPQVFLLFPFHHIGGAEKVHARIAAALAGMRPSVFFTHASEPGGFLADFRASARVFQVERMLRSDMGRRIFAELFVRYVNGRPNPVVVGGNCPIFYDLLPRLAGHVRCMDIVHGIGGGIERRSLPFVQRLERRVVVARQVREELAAYYDEHELPDGLSERIEVVENFAELPADPVHKDFHGRLKVLYVGRGAPEKRVGLLGRLAHSCHEAGLDAEFIFVGPHCLEAVAMEDRPYCRFVGGVNDFNVLADHYRSAHLLLLASVREGLPLALLDGMAFGTVPVVTAVGGVSEHVVPGRSGYLLSSQLPEEEILHQFQAYIGLLDRDRILLQGLSAQVANYAFSYFSRQKFEKTWRDLCAGGCSERSQEACDD